MKIKCEVCGARVIAARDGRPRSHKYSGVHCHGSDLIKKNPHAVALGRKGGSRKVPKGFSALTAEQRSENAKKAASARWSKRPKGAGR